MSNAIVKILFTGTLLSVIELKELSKIWHVDLKLDNFVLSRSGQVKAVDFGQVEEVKI